MRMVYALAVVLLAGGALVVLGVFASDPADDSDLPYALDAEMEFAPALTAAGVSPRMLQGGETLDGATLLKRLKLLDPDAAWKLLWKTGVGPEAKRVAHDPALIRYLLEALGSKERKVQQAATYMLGRVRPIPYEEVRPFLHHEEVGVRQAVLTIFTLWIRAGETFEDPGWVALLGDTDQRFATYAWSVVCNGVPYSAELADYCEARFEADTAASYFSVGRALAGMGPPGLDRLFTLLEKPESPVVYEVLSALRYAKPGTLAGLFPRLTPWIQSEDEDLQVLALKPLHMQGDDVAVLMPTLLEAWSHESFAVRLELLGLFERLGPKAKGAAAVLLAALDDGFDERITSRAMYLLGEMRALPVTALPRLRTALDDGGDDPAAIAMGAYGAAAVPYLRSALQSPDNDVRYFALAGVYRMGAASAALKDLVLPLITVDDAELAERAARAAGQMGEAASEVVPLLWQRYREGHLKENRLAEVFHGIGPTAGAFLVARLRGPQDEAKAALPVIATYPRGTEFAFKALGPALTADSVSSRRLAVQAVAAAARPPAPRNEEEYALLRTFIVPEPLRGRIVALLTPRKEDPDVATRERANATLGQLAAMAAREGARTDR